jgi:hypothetical protein
MSVRARAKEATALAAQIAPLLGVERPGAVAPAQPPQGRRVAGPLLERATLRTAEGAEPKCLKGAAVFDLDAVPAEAANDSHAASLSLVMAGHSLPAGVAQRGAML